MNHITQLGKEAKKIGLSDEERAQLRRRLAEAVERGDVCGEVKAAPGSHVKHFAFFARVRETFSSVLSLLVVWTG